VFFYFWGRNLNAPFRKRVQAYAFPRNQYAPQALAVWQELGRLQRPALQGSVEGMQVSRVALRRIASLAP